VLHIYGWYILDRTETRTRVHMPRAPGRRDENIWYGCAKYLWVLSIEQGSCQILGAYNFKFMQGFLKVLTPLY
jgi:hypothetical protein